MVTPTSRSGPAVAECPIEQLQARSPIVSASSTPAGSVVERCGLRSPDSGPSSPPFAPPHPRPEMLGESLCHAPSSAWSTAVSATSCSNVSSWLTETRSTVLKAAGVDPRARSWSRRPTLPGSSLERGLVERRELADRLDTCQRVGAARLSADAGKLAHVERREKRGLAARRHDRQPSGFRRSLATFATTLHDATPREHVRLVAPRPPPVRPRRHGGLRKSRATSPSSR